MKGSYFCLVGVFYLGLSMGYGQVAKLSLEKAGFEQVHRMPADSGKLVIWEHRNFRNPHHSLLWADRKVGDSSVTGFIPLYMNRPMGVYDRQTLSFRPVTAGERAFFRKKNRLPTGYRWNFRVSPDFSARFGDRKTPFRSRTNLILDTRVYLLPGLSVQTGVLVPIQNNLGLWGTHWRLAPSHLHYFAIPLPHHFVGITAGTFFQDRYGVHFQYRYDDFDKRWRMGLETAYTGYYFIPGRKLYTDPLSDVILLLDVEYRLNKMDLTFRISGGQFIGRDRGVRGDLIRQFGGVDVGLFSAITVNGTSGGFQFAFPLFPGKIARGRRWELRTTEEFRWEYNYSHAAPIGRTFRIGMPKLSDQLRQYNSFFIGNQ
ncbi:YjbH domain-containing protein [Lunatibacter salilacus]|uniref:YjbH domain-containing protein n=1 Tax=Lunatibacter salilacus TaxID=2483804 RepID=UPI00131A7FA3|nr:YjbH domain-containing protein [Lunatibacter salilacus]